MRLVLIEGKTLRVFEGTRCLAVYESHDEYATKEQIEEIRTMEYKDEA